MMTVREVRSVKLVHKEDKRFLLLAVRKQVERVQLQFRTIPGTLKCRIVDGQYMHYELRDHYVITITAEEVV